MNKRGQSLSTGAIILIILGVIVLVVLALGFTIGWNKLTPWLSQGNNVQAIATQCSTYCSLTSTYDYCARQMTVTANSITYNGTCNQFANDPSKITSKPVDSNLATNVKSFGVASCPAITCK